MFPSTKIFFPHSRKDYGSAGAEEALRAIRAAWPGCDIVDPRYINWKALAREEGDSSGADEVVVRDCQIVVALEREKHIGRGVYGGLSAALRLGRPAYVYRGGKMLRVKRLITVDPEDWALRFGRVEVMPDDDEPDPASPPPSAYEGEHQPWPADGDK